MTGASGIDRAAPGADADLDALWLELARFPDNVALKVRVARRLAGPMRPLQASAEPGLHALLIAPEVDPVPVARAGWTMVEATGRLPTADEAGAEALEHDGFLLSLLGETCVAWVTAEQALTALRRWLLMSGRAPEFPRTVRALVKQAALNGGAWPFDTEERARLGDASAATLAAAYLPERPGRGAAGTFASPVTDAVAAQYEAWPYPVWERVMTLPDDTLDALVASVASDAPALPPAPEILVAGCGSGRETLLIARQAPQARITAIDVSVASLARAAALCAAAANIAFARRDLHEVGAAGPRFDLVSCSGVLHHLPDPEAGWSALVDALKPGGLMSIMVYSRIARMRITAARRHITDLLDQPVDDDLLRDVRRRLLAEPVHAVAHSTDFASLGGVHDLLLHRHEDAFDVERIRRGVDRLGLEFLGFHLPGAERRARYREENPHDPLFRDFTAWARAEWKEPELFVGMYHFWCRKPA